MKYDSVWCTGRLEEAGVRVTANRIMVLRTLAESEVPLSLAEIECRIDSLERSSVLRVLSLLSERHVLHAVEDGRGVVRYEVCHGHGGGADPVGDDDMHVHFYCERCRRIVCFDDVPVPHVAVHEGFVVTGINYMLKGLCPECAERNLQTGRD